MNIKELAEEVGISFTGHPMNPLSVYFSELKRFAELVATAASAKEREACAELIEQVCHDDMTRAEEAAAIRARGDKHD